MQITFKFILSLTAVMIVVFGITLLGQERSERDRFQAEMKRNSRLLTDAFVVSAAPLLDGKSADKLSSLADDYVNRYKFSALTLYDASGRLLAESSEWARFPVTDAAQVMAAKALRDKAPDERIITLGREAMAVYAAPFHAGKNDYVAVAFHDARALHYRIVGLWRLNLMRAALIGVLFSLSVVLILFLSVKMPIYRTAEWIRKIRLGEGTFHQMDPAGKRLLGPVADEISRLTVSLTRAREAAEEEARLRQTSESLWTPERLKEFVRSKLDGRPLFVVSNREPYQHVYKGKEIECVVPASGLVTAIEPVLEACGGTWIAEGNGDADAETVDEHDRLRVPPEEPRYTLRRLWLTKEEEEGYYYGFSNEGIWPLCHVAHTRPTFREEDWLMYQAVNQKFADAALEELKGTVEPCVMIQDYHFALLPRLIKTARPDARVAIFWHIPWPNSESFGICPWQKELLLGMLAADIIGFHTQYHCNNFLQTVDRILESRIDYEHFTVNREGHTTWIKPFPISIAFLGKSSSDGSPDGAPPPTKESVLKPYGLNADFIGVGVDRLDYTKGILERFRSVERFLEKNPEYVGRFTFVELGAPSRSLIPKYQEFVLEVEREVERINNRFKAKNWKPILFLKKHHSQKDILPFYRAADLCMVTSLHDGMNLVAKEFVTARADEKGVLVLSQFTGAARELSEAIIINPYDVGQAADAIRTALNMPLDEQQVRMRHMRAILKDRNVYRWAADLINELATVRIENTFSPDKTNVLL